MGDSPMQFWYKGSRVEGIVGESFNPSLQAFIEEFMGGAKKTETLWKLA